MHPVSTKYYKYPKTPHLPGSKEISTDDITLSTVPFIKKEVVVSIKLDGEATSLYNDHFHARSLDSRMHTSRNWIAALHAMIKNDIPNGWRICGENLYATHSIHYTNLPTYFFVYGIYDDNNNCLNWKDTKEFCELLELITVPVIYEGIWNIEKINENFKKFDSFDGIDIITKEKTQEGWVARISGSFNYNDFAKNVAKMVRSQHVKTSDLWINQQIYPNELK